MRTRTALSVMVLSFLVIHGNVAANQVPDDTTQVNLLNRMAMATRESDYPQAEEYAGDALRLADRIGYAKGKAAALGNLGWVSYRKADFVKTLSYSIDALKISEQIGDKGEMARSMNNIAAVSFEQNQYEKAVNEFKQALGWAFESGEGKAIGRSLNNIAYVYFMSGMSLDSAEHYSKLAVEYSEKIKDNYLVAFGIRTSGDVLVKRKKYQEALALFERGIALSEASLNHAMKVATWHRVAKVYIQLGRKQEAIDILLRNSAEARSMGNLEELERTYKVVSEVYHDLNKEDKAYTYLRKYTALHDSIYTLQNSKQIALLQNEFDLSMKQAQIELLTKDTDLKQKEISSQRIQLYATILGASCVLLLVVVMLYSFQKVKRTNKELEQQKEQLANKNLEIEEKSKELESLNTTKDKLFSIIGHDFRSPLHSLRGLIELIATRNMTQEEFEYYTKDLRNKLDVVYSNLDNILHWSVSQLNGINAAPSKVNSRKLSEEVVELYAEIARVKGVRLETEVPYELTVWADKEQVRLVVRNLVSNALKFTTSGGSVTIGGSMEQGTATLFVRDTGVGIAEDDLSKLFMKQSLWSVRGTNNEKGLGLGLLLCKEFIEKNGGALDIKTEHGVGTTIAFSLPTSGPRTESMSFKLVPSQLASN